MRDDAHRPSVIQPEDYAFVGFEVIKLDDDLGAAQFLLGERATIRAHMASTGGTYSAHQHGGNCHICGAHAIYTALFHHKPTNSYIRTGLDCAQKLDTAIDGEVFRKKVYTALFHHEPSNTYVRTGLDCAEKLECQGVERFRKSVKVALEQTAGKRKAQALLDLHGLGKAWEIYTVGAADHREEETLIDIVGKLVRFGSVSDAQLNFVRSLVDRVVRRPEIEAQRKAENDAAKPVPVSTERLTVRGKILSVRVPNISQGECGPTRILVQHADGWKVWGSLAASISDAVRGDEVEFVATLKVSDKDTKFGFFSRPSKARILR